MDPQLRKVILDATGADELLQGSTIQSLWSGYGSLDRYTLAGADRESVIVKHVRLPHQNRHRYGWHSDFSQQRKLRSYQVEMAWYRHWAARCNTPCRVPHCLALKQQNHEVLIVLEDLDQSGYALRRSQVNDSELFNCLRWLAYFHATFMGEKPLHLWPIGTYWHLDTRPDELAAMPDSALKQAAQQLDRILNEAHFQTIVHGDAKLANFCFDSTGGQVAAVDFQYVGGGCGMKDVAYFLGSCLDESECAQREQELLDRYFLHLQQALQEFRPDINAKAVETCWRPLYAVAWTDFFRFLQGWSPGHWKIHSYSEHLAKKVLAQLDRMP